MNVKTAHPGVRLSQRAKGGTWFIRFFDPRADEPVQKSKSTFTDDFNIATRIAKEIHTYINNRDVWGNPPDTHHPRTNELLDIRPSDGDAKQLKRDINILAVPAKLAGIDASPTIKRAQKTLGDLQAALTRALQERDEWKRRAVAAEALNAKHGARAVKARAALEGLTLKAAATTWTSKLTGDAEYVNDQTLTANAFVRQFGETTLATDMPGRETEIDEWIRGLKNNRNKPIGAGRRLEIRRVVLKLLRETGVEMDKKAIKRPSKKDVRNDRGAIRWLTRIQARNVAERIQDTYFADCFRVQLALGLRPNELLTLKKADFSEIDGKRSLTLSPLAHLTLKEGSRTIIVPEHIHAILDRRLEASDILFPHVGGKHDGKPWVKAKLFDRRYVQALRAAGKAAGVPFDLDGRVARRTAATLLLGAGVAPKAVADILGDRLDTVIEHYGAAIPGTNDPSKAAI